MKYISLYVCEYTERIFASNKHNMAVMASDGP